MRIIKATYDGRDFHPDEPLTLPPNTRVTLAVHPEEPDRERDPAADVELPRTNETFAEAVRRIRIDGPADWSERVDYYMGRDVSRYSDLPDDEHKDSGEDRG